MQTVDIILQNVLVEFTYSYYFLLHLYKDRETKRGVLWWSNLDTVCVLLAN